MVVEIDGDTLDALTVKKATKGLRHRRPYGRLLASFMTRDPDGKACGPIWITWTRSRPSILFETCGAGEGEHSDEVAVGLEPKDVVTSAGARNAGSGLPHSVG